MHTRREISTDSRHVVVALSDQLGVCLHRSSNDSVSYDPPFVITDSTRLTGERLIRRAESPGQPKKMIATKNLEIDDTNRQTDRYQDDKYQ